MGLSTSRPGVTEHPPHEVMHDVTHVFLFLREADVAVEANKLENMDKLVCQVARDDSFLAVEVERALIRVVVEDIGQRVC